ncbi:MAG TPA: hypothetical protein VG370_02240, partial [Chloroflexota bacterium]|nr:hypothetical protein [Chloroflexota bacterium]
MEPAQFCPSCGRRRGEDDRFCAGCGRPVDRPDQPGAGYPPGAAGPRRLPPWERLKIVVPIAILALGYWLLAPLVWPAFAPEPPVAEAPTAVPRAQPVAPPGLGAPSSSPLRVPPGRGEGTGEGLRGASVATPASTTGGAVPSTPTEPLPRTEALAAGTPPAAMPTPSLYRGSPVEALKVEPRQVQTVRLGRVEAG